MHLPPTPSTNPLPLPPSLDLTGMLQGKLPSARTTDRRDSEVGRTAHLVSACVLMETQH